MVIISGFTFIHNAISGGYPLREAIEAVSPYVNEMVIVDMQSNDGTREWLDKQNIRVIDGYWGNEAGETLRQAHNLHSECQGDIIIHFEADEVYDDSLIRDIKSAIDNGIKNIIVYRLQLEQNFQRCRWYPEPVHRVFAKNSNTRKEGHTTNKHDQSMFILPPECGFLWDITNCFRDNYLSRIEAQKELWHGMENDKHLMVSIHASLDSYIDKDLVQQKLNERHWQWTVTPFNIPNRLKKHVGKKRYELELLD